MDWRCACTAASLLVLATMGGCALPAPEVVPPRFAAPLAAESPAAPERWILVRKGARTLTLYDGTQVLRTYAVVLGKDPYWAKLQQGDHRTPEGAYHIVDKYYHPSWSRFMLLDYPTAQNWEIYAWSRAHGALRRNPHIGGAIGIHGTDDEQRNRRRIDWTEGCVSLFNADVDELYELVPVGTRVVIER